MSAPGDRLRQLARRVKGRLGGGARPAGDRFGPDRDVAFAVLAEEGESAFNRVGASLVGAWEVGITDLARALEPRLATAAKNKLTERVSDALVPSQQPLNDGRHGFAGAVKAGTQAALRSARLADAWAPAVALLEGLGAATAAGWVKTTDYMGPLWEALPKDGDPRGHYLAQGPRLQALLDEAAAEFRGAMMALPQQSDLERAIRDAMDAWYARVSKGVEIIVYDGRSVMVQAAERLPKKTGA